MVSRADGRAWQAAIDKMTANRGCLFGADPDEVVDLVLTAYLDTLLSELPEEAVEAACEVVGNRGDGVFAKTVADPMLKAALLSLRSSSKKG